MQQLWDSFLRLDQFQSPDCFGMSIRVDLIVGKRGEDKEEEGEGIEEEAVDEEEIEVTDDASEADSGVDPGQDDQVNFDHQNLGQ